MSRERGRHGRPRVGGDLHHDEQRAGPHRRGGGQSITVTQLADLARRVGKNEVALIRQQITAFYTRTELLRFTIYRIRTTISHGWMPGPGASTTKLFVSQHVSLTGELVMELCGAGGLLADENALDGGLRERTFLNQWMTKLGAAPTTFSAIPSPSACSVCPARSGPTRTCPSANWPDHVASSPLAWAPAAQRR
jgi:hypothetical protein